MATGTGLPPVGGQPVLAQAPGVMNADALFNAQAWSNIASAGEKLADAGLASLKVTEHQAQIGSLAQSDVADRRKRIELQDEHSDSPQGFDQAWKAYSDGKLAEAEPRFVPHIRNSLGSEGNAGYSTLLNVKRQAVELQSKQSWTALEDTTANDVTGAAMAGELSSPEGQIKIAKYRGVIETGVTSQIIPREEADRRIASLESKATVYATREGVQKVFNTPGLEGGPIAAIKRIDEIVRDPKLQLSDNERLGLGTRMRADVHAWDAERTQNLASVDQRAQALLQLQKLGQPVPEGQINETVEQYNRFGGQAQSASFLATIQNANRTSWVARAPLPDSAAWLEQFKTERGFNSPPQAAKRGIEILQQEGFTLAQAQGIMGNGVHESGLNPNATHDVDPKTGRPTGLGIFGWRDDPDNPSSGRRTALVAFAKERGTSPNDFETQVRFAAQELRTTEKRAGDAVRAATTPEQAAAAFIHFERPLGYDPADVTKSHGYSNRVGQAVRLAGGVMPAATTSDVSLAAASSKIVGDRVSAEATAIIKGMDNKENPVFPTATRINELLSAAATANSPEALENVAQAAHEFQWRRQFGQKPLPQETAFVSEMHAKAVADGLSTNDARLLQIATETRDLTAQRLQDDPLTHAAGALAETAQLAPLGPLDLSSSASFQAGLQHHARWAEIGTRTFETAAMPALTAAEMTQVRAALDASNPAEKARIYRDLGTLPPATRAATLSRLGGKGGPDMIEAFAGAMFGVEPAVGESIIRGQNAMKVNESFNPLKEANKSSTLEKLDKFLPADVFSRAARTDPNGPYATMRGAVVARVADLAAGNPAFRSDFPDALFERAVNDVTGGIVTHNGAPAVSPVRGQGQAAFESRMHGLTDGDLVGVTTQTGRPLTAEYVRNTANLESIADGRYLVRLGKDAERPIYAFRDVGAAVQGRMRPFVLDLRTVTPTSLRVDRFSNAMPQP